MPDLKVITFPEEVNVPAVEAEHGLILVEDAPAVCETCDGEGVVSMLTRNGEEEFSCAECNPPED